MDVRVEDVQVCLVVNRERVAGCVEVIPRIAELADS